MNFNYGLMLQAVLITNANSERVVKVYRYDTGFRRLSVVSFLSLDKR